MVLTNFFELELGNEYRPLPFLGPEEKPKIFFSWTLFSKSEARSCSGLFLVVKVQGLSPRIELGLMLFHHYK
jgi:hypothetical protein